MAHEAGLGNADKLESQDICFVPDGDYATFIEEHTGATFVPGPIVDEAGTVLGKHNGLVHYTIGQRKGLGVAAGHPLFVLKKDAKTNTLVVGPRHFRRRARGRCQRCESYLGSGNCRASYC